MFDAIGGLLGLPGYSTAQWAAGQAPSFTQMNQDGGVTTQAPYNWGAINGADLPLIGWNGGNPYQQVSPDSDIEAGHSFAGNGALTPEFQKFMADGGYSLGTGQGPSGYASQFYQNGQPIGVGSKYGGGSEGDIFGLATLAAGGLAGAAAAGAGGLGAAGGATLEGGAYPAAITGGDAGGLTGGFSVGAANAQGLTDAQLAQYSQLYGQMGQQALGDAGLNSSMGAQAIEGAAAGAPAVAGGGASSADLAALYGPSGYGSTAADAGGGFMDTVGNGLKSIGDFTKQYPGLTNVGGALVNGLIGASTANRAIGAQQSAINQANAMWKPYADFGVQNGLNPAAKLLQNPNSITQDPGYQFGLNQGQTAIDRSAASKGGLYSGATQKALERYGQDYAGTKFDQALGRYEGAAQLGATGTSNISNNLIGGGNAQAGASLYSGNVANNALNSLLGQFNYSQYQKRPGG